MSWKFLGHTKFHPHLSFLLKQSNSRWASLPLNNVFGPQGIKTLNWINWVCLMKLNAPHQMVISKITPLTNSHQELSWKIHKQWPPTIMSSKEDKYNCNTLMNMKRCKMNELKVLLFCMWLLKRSTAHSLYFMFCFILPVSVIAFHPVTESSPCSRWIRF